MQGQQARLERGLCRGRPLLRLGRPLAEFSKLDLTLPVALAERKDAPAGGGEFAIDPLELTQKSARLDTEFPSL